LVISGDLTKIQDAMFITKKNNMKSIWWSKEGLNVHNGGSKYGTINFFVYQGFK
jgi:hypothetical protein